jgi:hypothetical protein
MIAAMLATDALTAAQTWRPQEFGDGRARDVDDPIVEPLWTGPRVLAFVGNDQAALSDVDGEAVLIRNDLRAALIEAVDGATVLIEGTLTPEPLQAPDDLAAREGLALPKPSRVATQLLIGDRGDRKDRLVARIEEVQRRATDRLQDEVALVAVDLVWLDDESLLDIPLLERKRILESVLAESRLIRLGSYVKPPIDTWLGAWRTFGFRRIAYKGANSRYVPGVKNQAWALAEIPRR